MERVIHIDPELLAWSLTLSPEQRLRQANAAFRLYHHLHRPFEKPFVRSFATVEEFFRFQKEHASPR
jgi:hypothetical protein